ncbi:MAG: 1,4-alpha-glucan-branching enzyme, partial [Muribaculaceae bacterium]|nr:1,4-alpha-glucan-branching enzyme [Muribaculaceae bacterium]
MKSKDNQPKPKTAPKKAASAQRRKKSVKVLPIIKNDPWLEPFADAINGRHEEALRKRKELGDKLIDFANAHHYFGLHHNADGTWTFREWAPHATAITLIGDFSRWNEEAMFALKPIGNGVWEINLPADVIHHGDHYKMMVHWDGGEGQRVPAYATRVVQDPNTALFSAQVWEPETRYAWINDDFRPDTKPLLIYECHIGMAQQREGVGTYNEFRENVLPRIAADGYNAIQIMAIQEHPYFG